MAKVNTQQALAAIKDNLLFLIPDLKQQQSQLEFFLTSIEPDLDEALATGDLMSLDFIKDRIVGRTARVSLGIINKQREKVVTVAVAVIRTLVGIGIAAV